MCVSGWQPIRSTAGHLRPAEPRNHKEVMFSFRSSVFLSFTFCSWRSFCLVFRSLCFFRLSSSRRPLHLWVSVLMKHRCNMELKGLIRDTQMMMMMMMIKGWSDEDVTDRLSLPSSSFNHCAIFLCLSVFLLLALRRTRWDETQKHQRQTSTVLFSSNRQSLKGHFTQITT